MKSKSLTLKVLGGSAALLGLILTFQNCSPSSAKSVKSLGSSAVTASGGSSNGSAGGSSSGGAAKATVKIDDMILDTTAGARQSVSGKNLHLYATTGFASYGSQNWANGVIPLSFASGITADQIAMVKSACQEWGSVSSVTCVDRTTEDSYVLVSNVTPDDCSANVGAGLSGGIRAIHLGNNCWTYPIVLHEFGHTIGFLHEHQRADRDQYIKVHLENVATAYQSNLSLLSRDSVQRPYDFASIMHYASTAFSNNGKATLVPVAAYANQVNLMGASKHLSDLDKTSVASLYPPVVTNQPAPVVYSTHMIYRYISDDGQHLFTMGDNDNVPPNFTLEGPVFLLFDNPGPNMNAVLRCTYYELQFLSGDPQCEGGSIVETIGYVAGDNSIPNTSPLIRWSDANGDYLQGQDPTEALDNGYSEEGPIGYAPY